MYRKCHGDLRNNSSEWRIIQPEDSDSFFYFQRDHNKILLFMILMGVGVIVSFIQVFQLGFLFLIPSLLAAVCSIYFFVCIYSLYQVLKAERMDKLEPDQHPGVNYENVVLRRMW